jgi:predicted O-methyltransferase YrrM
MPSLDWTQITGWLTKEEGEILAELSMDQRVLEVGSYYGRSTVCMARGAGIVHCVDPFMGITRTDIPQKEKSTRESFEDNLELFDVSHKVVIWQGTSHELLPTFESKFFDMCFVDGCHDYEVAKFDCEQALRLVRKGGVIVVHDYEMAEKHLRDVTKAVDEVFKKHRVKKEAYSLAVVRL